MNTDFQDDPDKQRAVQSVEVGGRLLLALSHSDIPLPLKDLAARAGLSASRAHPYLVSYQRLGLVEQEPATGWYALGPAALQIGLACLHQLDSMKAAGPVAEELARNTGHSVALSVWGNFGPTIVRLFEARQPLHVSLRVGTVMSVYGTATGRAFAAALPIDKLERTTMSPVGESRSLSMPPPARAAELADIVDEVARHGVTRAVGLPIPGVNAFSAAAFDHEGVAAVVVTVLDHQDRLSSDWNSSGAIAVRAAAQTITKRLGGKAASAEAQKTRQSA
ncbi:MAG: transcriptional regulator, IclR family [Ramlibacter sp.]|nr:transcriptional regulator, IclR family [Ramlibacter sp.]